MPDLHQADAKV